MRTLCPCPTPTALCACRPAGPIAAGLTAEHPFKGLLYRQREHSQDGWPHGSHRRQGRRTHNLSDQRRLAGAQQSALHFGQHQAKQETAAVRGGVLCFRDHGWPIWGLLGIAFVSPSPSCIRLACIPCTLNNTTCALHSFPLPAINGDASWHAMPPPLFSRPPHRVLLSRSLLHHGVFWAQLRPEWCAQRRHGGATSASGAGVGCQLPLVVIAAAFVVSAPAESRAGGAWPSPPSAPDRGHGERDGQKQHGDARLWACVWGCFAA